MTARFRWGMVLLLAVASVRAEMLPLPGAGDARIRVVTYSADQVYRLYARVGYDLRLEFAPDEHFVSLDGGDLEALTYAAHDAVLSVKPRAITHTNFTVTTTRRHYYFEYTASAGDPRDVATETAVPVIYVVRFQYAPETSTETASKQDAQAVEAALAGAPAARAANTNYWYCGDPSVRPVAASDDGVHTRITFAPRAELPALFVRNDDGSESLLNFSLDDGAVVIHRIARQFVVRRGGATGCITNASFQGGGIRLKTGTISPAVERTNRVPLP